MCLNSAKTMTDSAKMVTVRCHNHHRELTTRLWNLLLTKQGLDYELMCGERSVRAHGVMLHAFLSNNDAAQGAAGNERAPREDLLHSALEFLYKGTVTLSRERLDDFQETARQLNFHLLVDAVEETKKCKPLKIVIPRVDDNTSGEVLELNSRPACRQVKERTQHATEKRQLSISDVEETMNTSEFWICQPDVSERELDVSGTGSAYEHVLPQNEVQWMVQKCYSCDFESTSITLLMFHQASTHDSSIPIFRCSRCKALFETEAEMERHCQHCEVRTRTGTSVSIGSRKVDRLEAGSELGSKESVHQRAADVRVWRCAMCSYEASSNSQLGRHLVDAEGNPISALRCPECDYSNTIGYQLMLHKRKKRTETKEGVEEERDCQRCDFRVNSDYSLTLHLCENHPTDADGCPLPSEASLDVATSKAWMLKCTLCDFETLHRSQLSTHRKRTHPTDGNPLAELTCSECGYSTFMPKCLKKHRRLMHSDPKKKKRAREFMIDDKEFKCSMCNFVSSYYGNLLKHQRRFHCCNAVGDPVSELMQHSSQEAMKKGLHKCQFCNRLFRLEEELNEHMIHHLKDKCDSCSLESSYESNLAEHRKRDHPVDERDRCRGECHLSDTLDRHSGRHGPMKHSGQKVRGSSGVPN